MKKRLVLKLGTSSICDEFSHVPLLSTLSLVTEVIIKLRAAGHDVVLVSSGAIGTGLRVLGWAEKPKEMAKKQAIAAIGQGRLMSLYETLFSLFAQPIAQVLLTRSDLAQRNQHVNAAATFEALLEMGVVPIVNENDTISVAEIKFGDNDTLSAITAGLIRADYLFLLTDVDCLYEDNPRDNPNAKPIRLVQDINDVRSSCRITQPGGNLGTGGMVTKIIAAELAMAAGVDTVIMKATKLGQIFDILTELSTPTATTPTTSRSDLLYTRFAPQKQQLQDHKWWIRHGMVVSGSVFVDAGTVEGLLKFKGSLFPAGVVQVQGPFAPQQAVRVVARKDGKEVEVARGVVNYSSQEVERIKGHQSSEIRDILGYADSDCLIYRDNLVRCCSWEEWSVSSTS